MGDQNMGGDSGSEMDIQSILTGTSGSTDTTQGSGLGGSSQSGSQSEGGYTFAGRTFKGGQKEAEAWANKVYGQSSEQKGIINWLKTKGLKDPELLSQLAQDPEWADTLAKLGIEVGADATRGEDVDENEYAEGDDSPQAIMNQLKVDRAGFALEREEMAFERKLGRQVKEEEHNQVMGIIERAPSLSYAEAWKLAFHDRMLKEAHMKAQQGGQGSRRGNRPPPIPGIPGTKVDPKKSITEMSPSEWRESLRQSDEFQNLMSREK